MSLALPPYTNLGDVTPNSFDAIPGKFQTFPIHVVEKYQDNLLRSFDDACPNNEIWKLEN